jgi:hypothetical protein
MGWGAAVSSYTLTIRDTSGVVTERRFEAPTVTLGRKKTDIILDDPSVSSRHAEITFEGGVLAFMDVGSSNGSFDATGKRITAQLVLSVGTQIRMGGCWLEIIEIDGPDELDQRTAMLSTEQIEEMLGGAAGAQAAPEPARRAPEPARRAPEPAYRAPEPAPRAPEPVYRAPEPARNPEPARRAPEPVRAPEPAAAEYDDEDDGMVPVSGPPSDWGVPNSSPAGKTPGKPAGQSAQRSAPPPSAARPEPDGELEDPPPIEDESPAIAAKLLPDAVMTSLDLVKNWKNGPAVGVDDVKQALSGGFDLLMSDIKGAPLPLLAVSGVQLVLGYLMFWIPSLFGILGYVSWVVSLANIVAYSASALCLIGALVGQPIDPLSAVKRVISDPIPLIVSFFLAGLVTVIGSIALILPGIALGAYMFPAYWIEGRRNLGLNVRSLDLFKKDGRRLILVGVALIVVSAVANSVIHFVLGNIPAVGFYLMWLVGAVWSALMASFGIAVTLWLYFDLRARRETGDAEAEAREQLAA